MSLVSELRAVQDNFNASKPHFPELKEKRLDKALRNIIERYRVEEYQRDKKRLATFSIYKDALLPSTHPNLDAVINGETTYQQMVFKTGWQNYMTSKAGFFDTIIFHANSLNDFKKDVKFLDETIQRVYRTYKPTKKV